jgi:hypothetical protein
MEGVFAFIWSNPIKVGSSAKAVEDGGGKSSKHQDPSSREAPNFNL